MKLNILNLFFNIVSCMLLAVVLVPFLGYVGLGAVLVLFLLGFVPVENKFFPENSLHAEVIRTIFTSDLQKNLYPNDEFYSGCKVDTGVDINAKTVEIPNAGLPPAVVKNPQVLPIPARIREDDKVSYEVDMYATEPDIVTDVNQAIVSYDKRAAILDDHRMTLQKRIADELSIIWCPTRADNLLRTTGTDNTGTLVAGMTGNRKEITYADIVNLAMRLDRMEVPDDGRRRLLIYSEQYRELLAIPEFKDFDKSGLVGNVSRGSIGRILNFEVFKRNVPMVNTSTGAKKAFGSAVAATDCLRVLAYHPSFVRYAQGNAKVYYEAGKVGYQGDMMNAAVRGGGTISRLDERGVVRLVQE